MKKISKAKIIPITCLVLLITMLIAEVVISLMGADWLDRKFYLLRSIRDLSVQGIVIFVIYHVYNKQYKKITHNYDIVKEEIKIFRAIEFVVFIFTTSVICAQVLVRNLNQPGHYGDLSNTYLAGGLLIFIPFLLGQLKLNPEERRRKRIYILLLIIGILGIFFVGTVILNFIDILSF